MTGFLLVHAAAGRNPTTDALVSGANAAIADLRISAVERLGDGFSTAPEQ